MIDDLNKQQWENYSLLAHLRPVWMRIEVSNLSIEVLHFKKVGDLPIFIAQLPTKKPILAGQTEVVHGYIDETLALP